MWELGRNPTLFLCQLHGGYFVSTRLDSVSCIGNFCWWTKCAALRRTFSHRKIYHGTHAATTWLRPLYGRYRRFDRRKRHLLRPSLLPHDAAVAKHHKPTNPAGRSRQNARLGRFRNWQIRVSFSRAVCEPKGAGSGHRFFGRSGYGNNRWNPNANPNHATAGKQYLPWAVAYWHEKRAVAVWAFNQNLP